MTEYRIDADVDLTVRAYFTIEAESAEEAKEKAKEMIEDTIAISSNPKITWEDLEIYNIAATVDDPDAPDWDNPEE